MLSFEAEFAGAWFVKFCRKGFKGICNVRSLIAKALKGFIFVLDRF
jgi:hypothetical protein